MLLEIVKQFNWVDIFIIIILFRICYIAIQGGLPVELFKLPGTIMATYLGLHYFSGIAESIHKSTGTEKIPIEFFEFLSFLGLAIAGYLLFVILRFAFYRFIKMEALPHINKWGGFILGIARAFLFLGLFTFGLAISSVNYLQSNVKASYLGSRFLAVSPKAYTWMWNSLASKFMGNEKFNEAAVKLEKD